MGTLDGRMAIEKKNLLFFILFYFIFYFSFWDEPCLWFWIFKNGVVRGEALTFCMQASVLLSFQLRDSFFFLVFNN